METLNLPDIATYRESLKVQEQFYTLLESTKKELLTLYGSGQVESKMRIAKEGILRDLVSRYEKLRESEWDGKQWYKTWFDTPLTNAKFSALSTYRDRCHCSKGMQIDELALSAIFILLASTDLN